MPTDIGFGPEGSIWCIGWQRDRVRNDLPDASDYAIVRRYSRTGKETGAFLPRSLWKTTGEPATAGLGYWRLAMASDRMGTIVYESYADRTPEWVEWNYNGQLLSRTPLVDNYDGGKAYTADGRLFAGVLDRRRKGFVLSVLDRQTGKWLAVHKLEPGPSWNLLLGAHGEDLVFKSSLGATELLWVRAPR